MASTLVQHCINVIQMFCVGWGKYILHLQILLHLEIYCSIKHAYHIDFIDILNLDDELQHMF